MSLPPVMFQWYGRVGMELDRSTNFELPPIDRRPHVPEPPPVRLVAIEEIRATAPTGVEAVMDRFYESILMFERETQCASSEICYKAENGKLFFELTNESIDRQDLRPIGVEVPFLGIIETKLVEREIDYQRLRGLTAGHDALLVRDPAGNWVSITEARGVR